MTADPGLEMNRELIQQLCLEAGRIMEDASATLAPVLPAEPILIGVRVGELHHAALQIIAMANAASALISAPQHAGGE
jgi:hypothetical protein